MNSAFPGVDPYIEDQNYWADFHARFLPAWSEAISDLLPADYEARIDERMQIVELEGAGRSYLPDFSVVHDGSTSEGMPRPRPATATLETAVLDLPVMQPVRERWIQILHRPEKRIVAVLELLSPTNKGGEGRGHYLAKRTEFLNQPVHLVEVDLLLGGDRLPMLQPLPPGDFYTIISRSESPRKGRVYAWTLKDRMPAIPIPLLKPDADIVVDLGAVFATAIARGKYAQSLDYTAPLAAPLNAASKQWAEQFVQKK